ncbi:MAG: hypothetical protein CME62_14370 [Halobacteriovoraceae bacterium]|nr:hypothetical protein [Halobacteriovoraceae bacterium]|tara:strand:- start:4197 stop:4817 length:621 start_codon:yes stop_codon:yes gene_type:complete
MNSVQTHIDKILNHYSQDEYSSDMKKALDIYIAKTGQMNEESEWYESRMNSFNDWFVFNYRRDDGTRIIDQYVIDEGIDDDLAKSFHNLNYSLFLFQKTNFRKQIVIRDILHNKKIILDKDNDNIGLLEDDLFVGRVIELNGSHYLLNGLCILPREVYSALKKEAKKIRKQNNEVKEQDFLLELENLKTKSLNYSHITSDKIFTFG